MDKGADEGKPEWVEGEPANLAAAVEDAVEWMQWVERRTRGENRERVQRAIRALREQAEAT